MRRSAFLFVLVFRSGAGLAIGCLQRPGKRLIRPGVVCRKGFFFACKRTNGTQRGVYLFNVRRSRYRGAQAQRKRDPQGMRT
jgi:hypothetical protein